MNRNVGFSDRHRRTRAAVAAAGLSVMVLGVVAAPTAGAAAASSDFGRHVFACVQEHGFDGEHNPGAHEGRSDWSADHECVTEGQHS